MSNEVNQLSCDENLQQIAENTKNISNLLTIIALELVGKEKLTNYLTIIDGGTIPNDDDSQEWGITGNDWNTEGWG